MAEEEKDEDQEEQDDSEEKFFQRVKGMTKEAMNEWAAELSAEIDDEEEKKPPRPQTEKVKVAFEAKKKPAKPAKAEETEEDEAEDEDEEPERTPAERSREAGRRGPGRPSGYWERVGHKILYGDRRR